MIIYLKYIPAFLWMLVILLLSSEPAATSTARSDVILNAVQSVNVSLLQDATEFIIRKAAHFSAYFILGILLFISFKSKTWKRGKTAIVATSVSFLYACSDEVHQLFVPGRSGQLTDVLIDTLGALCGVGLYVLISHLWNTRTSFKRE